MRPIDKSELKVVSKLYNKGRIASITKPKRLKVFYQDQGNFTIATVSYDGEFAAGVAKRNPGDRYSNDIGETIALSRALKAMFAPLPAVGEASL